MMRTMSCVHLILLVVIILVRCESDETTSLDDHQHFLPACCDEANTQREDDNNNNNNVERQRVLLGYLTAVKGDLHNRQGRAISGALTYALERINNCSCVLDNVYLDFVYKDTEGKENQSTKAVVDLICQDVAAFIGPEGPNCHTEAMVAGSKNRAMISYRCADAQISSKTRYPTFTRMEPPDTQVTNSVLSLLEFYKWRQFSIVLQQGSQWEAIAKHLNEQALNQGMVVNHYVTFKDQHHCCVHELDCCNSMWPHPILKETKDSTRIYVFIGQREMLVRFMKQMKVEQLFADGKYMVIYLFPDTAVYHELGFFLWNKEDSVSPAKDQNRYESCEEMGQSALDQWRSLIIVSGSPYRVDTTEFAGKVRSYNERPPFSFSNPDFDIFNKFFTIHISIYAAHLYDSVMLYAKALDHVIKEEMKKVNGTNIDVQKLAREGRRITDTIIGMGGYKSISGNFIRIDENGDSEGNFTAFALKAHNYSYVSRITGKTKFRCPFYPVKVGEFHSNSDHNVTYSPKVNIDWPRKHKPVDEPHCGYDGAKCPRTKGRTEVMAIVLAGVLMASVGVTLYVYRKWKIEQEIEGLLWKIPRDNLQGYRGLTTCPSKMSLGSILSGESQRSFGFTHTCITARYGGAIVRVKELVYERKKDVPRHLMKEMKIMREMRHSNINSFLGACVESHTILLVTEFCAKGALADILENADIKLDEMFVASLVHDLIKGMLYLHNSDLGTHGNLRSSNCVITSRWTLKVADFGLHELRQAPDRVRHPEDDDTDDVFESKMAEDEWFKLLWKAPELMRDTNAPIGGTQKGDVYAFGIILFEIYGRQGPYGHLDNTPISCYDIVQCVITGLEDGQRLMRPDINILQNTQLDYHAPQFVIELICECWRERPSQRPDFGLIRHRLKALRTGMKANIMDQMVEKLEKYSTDLEDLVADRTRLLYEEKQKTEDLLYRMLPTSVARRLTHGIAVEPESFSGVTIYFSDIVGFTSMCSESTPLQVVNFLNELYSKFDMIIQSFDVYKVETIGDAYMVVSGLPERNEHHAGQIASLALELLAAVKSFKISHRPKETLKLRIGIHTGPVVAGVVGLAMPRYCLFGDTVNTSSRMESNGLPLKIHTSQACHSELTRLGGYRTECRGQIEMKGKGKVTTYWLLEATDACPIRKRQNDASQLGNLKPFFRLPKNFSATQTPPPLAISAGMPPGSSEMRRRASPRVSEPQTPDSVNRESIHFFGAQGPVVSGERHSTAMKLLQNQTGGCSVGSRSSSPKMSSKIRSAPKTGSAHLIHMLPNVSSINMLSSSSNGGNRDLANFRPRSFSVDRKSKRFQAMMAEAMAEKEALLKAENKTDSTVDKPPQ